MKIPNLRITFVIMAVLSLVLSPATGYAKSTSDSEIQVTVSNNPSLEDANWSIIKTEKKVVTDPSTGQESILTAITRRGPADEDQVPCKDKNGNITNDADTVALPTVTCVLGRTSLTRTANNPVGGVTAYVKLYADEYCIPNLDCAYRKQTKIQAWWKRIGTGYVVRSAWMRWGCNGSCAVCPGSIYVGYITSATFTPNWNGGLTSSVYTLTKSDWPKMKSAGTGDVFGMSHGVVETPSHTNYVIEVYDAWPR